MSEWYNSQKKPSSNFRKLLQERLDKVNPRRKLAKDETTKELLSNLVFEDCWSCGDLVRVGGFNSVFESNAGDDLGEIIKAA